MNKKKMYMIGCKMDNELKNKLETFSRLYHENNKSLVIRIALKEFFLKRKFNKVC